MSFKKFIKTRKLNFLTIFFISLLLITAKPIFSAPSPQSQDNQLPPQEQNFSPEIEYPTFAGSEPTKSLPEYVAYIYKFAIGSAGFLAMLMLIIGGIRLISAGGNPQNIIKARNQILNSIIGLGIILLSASILNIINPDLLVLKEASITEYTPESDFETLAKEWKEKHTPSGGSSSTPSLYVGAVYNAGKKIDCYSPEEKYKGDEKTIILKGLIPGDADGYACDELDNNKNHIFCSTDTFSEDDWEKEDAIISKCEKVCDIGSSSCPKVEGYIDDCEMPATCAEVKEKGIKSECNDNYIYCLTTQAPPQETSSGGGGGGSGSGSGESGGVYIGCPCDHPLEGPPKNGYTCSEIDPSTGNEIVTRSGYCAVYEVCYNKKCYDLRGSGKCFCNKNDHTYKCMKYIEAETAVVATFKTGRCEDVCSDPPITDGDHLPCARWEPPLPDLEY